MKSIYWILCFLLILVGLAFAFERGDANGNGKIDIFDALNIAEYLAGLKTDGELPGFADSDVNENSLIDIFDALYVAEHLAGLRDENYNTRSAPGPTPVASRSYIIVDVSGGSKVSEYTYSEQTSAPIDLLTNSAYKSTKIVLRKITAGQFTMGSPSTEADRGNEEIQHSVTLTKDYYMGVFEVTQAQWDNVMGTSPSSFTGDYLPVEKVSWDDVRGGSFAGNSGNSLGLRKSLGHRSMHPEFFRMQV